MRPIDIGPFAETMITTRESDVDETTDNKNSGSMIHVIITLFIIGPAMWFLIFMGLFTWAYIGLIIPITIIGLAIWACGYYGTNNSIIDKIRYRTTKAQRAIIKRRLSDIK